MAIDTVKWFNPTKGYGFIQPESGGKDMFLHISAVERAGLITLNEGARVSYEGKETAGRCRRKTSGWDDLEAAIGQVPSKVTHASHSKRSRLL